MSTYRGHIWCPGCGHPDYSAQNWDTYVSIVCPRCGYKLGELVTTEFITQLRQFMDSNHDLLQALADNSPPVRPAPNRMPHSPDQQQHQPDHQDDNPERPQDRDSQQEPSQHQDQADHDHH